MDLKIATFTLAAAVVVYPSPSDAQTRRAATESAGGVPVEITLQVGSQKYNASGNGECRSAERASIYGVSASQFAVSHTASGGNSLNLTRWQPTNGADMLTLSVTTGGKRYDVDTVKAGPKKDTKGSAQTTLQRSGNGAVLSINAVAASGEKISGTIKCSALAPVRAEGG